MALLAIVLVFVVAALAAFFLAMGGGGPKREREGRARRKGAKGATAAFALVLVVMGIGIPAYAITSDRDRSGDPEENLPELTELQRRGQELFGQRCRNCHTLAAANASANIGPSFDENRQNYTKGLVLDAIDNGRARGNGQMAADLVQGEDAEAVAEFVAVATGNWPE